MNFEEQNPGRIIVSRNQSSRIIRITDAVYFETCVGNIIIHYMKNGHPREFTFSGRLKDVEERLSSRGFIRVHRCFVVAVGRIDAIEGEWITVDDGLETKIPIGRVYAANIREALFGKDAETLD